MQQPKSWSWIWDVRGCQFTTFHLLLRNLYAHSSFTPFGTSFCAPRFPQRPSPPVIGGRCRNMDETAAAKQPKRLQTVSNFVALATCSKQLQLANMEQQTMPRIARKEPATNIDEQQARANPNMSLSNLCCHILAWIRLSAKFWERIAFTHYIFRDAIYVIELSQKTRISGNGGRWICVLTGL